MRHCPKCATQLQEGSLANQVIDRCMSCGGLWLDESELGAIVRQMSPPASEVKSAPTVAGLCCPDCEIGLESHNYAHDSGHLINKCEACGGVWLEKGQLELIAQYRRGSPAIRQLGDSMAADIQRQNRTALASSILRSRLLSVAVAIVLLFLNVNVFHIELPWRRHGRVARRVVFYLITLVGIWFPDEVGRYKPRWMGLPRNVIHEDTPGDMVAFVSWLLMFSPTIGWLIWRLF